MTWPKGTARAITRSLDIYYRDAARTARMDRLNAQFVGPGTLAFDIGAHLGDRTASFRRLGANVVAVEPQPAIFRALRLLQGKDTGVRLLPKAVGAREGQTSFYVNTANPTVSTASTEFVSAAPGAEAWRDQIWDRQISIDVTTLDHLVEQYGTPDHVKIDVEGFEAEVLRGLSHPIQSLAFEFTTLQREVAYDALEALSGLGPYVFNYSLGERHALALSDWISVPQMAHLIQGLDETANSGDVYARLQRRHA